MTFTVRLPRRRWRVALYMACLVVGVVVVALSHPVAIFAAVWGAFCLGFEFADWWREKVDAL